SGGASPGERCGGGPRWRRGVGIPGARRPLRPAPPGLTRGRAARSEDAEGGWTRGIASPEGDRVAQDHSRRDADVIARGKGPDRELPARGQCLRRQAGGLRRLHAFRQEPGTVLGGAQRTATRDDSARRLSGLDRANNEETLAMGAPDGASLRVLHLEDDARDAELIQAELEQNGYRVATECVLSRDAFIARLTAGGFDLILSD